jgi:DNA topoisomerase-1
MGRFYGCEKYPDCKGTIPYKIGMKCPKEGCDGDVIERRSRSRKLFYACSRYPDCDYTSFVNPLYRKEDKAAKQDKPEKQTEPEK